MIIPIDSLDDPRVQCYRDVKSRPVLPGGHWFIAEGIKVVERLLASDFATASVLVTERRQAEWSQKVPDEIPLYVIPQGVGEQLVGFNFHVGVLACGERRRSPSLESLAALADTKSPLLLAICPHCDNPENLGAICRISAAFGVDAILLGPNCCDPYSRRVIRVSMGAVFRQTLIDSNDLITDLRRLRDQFGIDLVATVVDPKAENINAAPRSLRLGVLFGNEDQGLNAATLAECTRLVTIPQRPDVDSLNVAVAAGIILQHFSHVDD